MDILKPKSSKEILQNICKILNFQTNDKDIIDLWKLTRVIFTEDEGLKYYYLKRFEN